MKSLVLTIFMEIFQNTPKLPLKKYTKGADLLMGRISETTVKFVSLVNVLKRNYSMKMKILWEITYESIMFISK